MQYSKQFWRCKDVQRKFVHLSLFLTVMVGPSDLCISLISAWLTPPLDVLHRELGSSIPTSGSHAANAVQSSAEFPTVTTNLYQRLHRQTSILTYFFEAVHPPIHIENRLTDDAHKLLSSPARTPLRAVVAPYARRGHFSQGRRASVRYQEDG